MYSYEKSVQNEGIEADFAGQERRTGNDGLSGVSADYSGCNDAGNEWV